MSDKYIEPLRAAGQRLRFAQRHSTVTSSLVNR